MNTLETYEKNQLKELSQGKAFPKFNPGDTLKVHLKVKEGEKERIQVFEGVCISKKNAGLNSSFTVRKISYGEGIERVLPLYSPQISKIEIVKSGDVRRSKLYYLRGRSGRSARITEKNVSNEKIEKKQDQPKDLNKSDEKEKTNASEKKENEQTNIKNEETSIKKENINPPKI